MPLKVVGLAFGSVLKARHLTRTFNGAFKGIFVQTNKVWSAQILNLKFLRTGTFTPLVNGRNSTDSPTSDLLSLGTF